MRARSSGLGVLVVLGVMVVLASGLAWAQSPRPTTPARSPQGEKRRKLLEEIGLETQKQSAPAPAAATGAAPSPGGIAPEPAADDAGAPSPPGVRKTPAAPTAPTAPSFRRVIHPLLMSTCSACHRPGGQAGATHLTLSGDVAADHAGVLRLVAVRGDPTTSALLLKASGQPHGGGSPWPPDSGAYGRVLAWITKGAPLDRQAEGVATPSPPALLPAKKSVPLPTASAPAPALPLAPTSAPAQVPVAPSVVSSPEAAVPTVRPMPTSESFASVHQILMSACAACHRPGAPAALSRLVLSGDAAVDEASARVLVEPSAPKRSLLLTKATGAMHGGGPVLKEEDPRYAALLAWASPDMPSPAVPPAGAGPAAIDRGPFSTPPSATAPQAPSVSPRSPHTQRGGWGLPLGFVLNGRFDLNYERREFSGHAFGSEGVDALRSYHHFLFLSRAREDEPCGLSLEIVALTFWEAHCRVTSRSRPVALTVAGGKIVVPFGADPLYHQSYGGLAGFDQRILPPIWAEEGVAAHAVYERGDLVVTDDLFAVRGYGLSRADGVLNLQNDVSPADNVHFGWGNRIGAAWNGISAWYSAYFNPLGFDRHLFMQALDVTVYRQRSIPVLGHFSVGAGALRADVAGGGGGAGKDYYHFGSYFQLRYHPNDWLFAQYRQGLRTFDNRRGVILDNSRLTSGDGSTHSFGIVGRHQGLSAGLFYFVNLEKADEIPDDLFRVSVTYEF